MRRTEELGLKDCPEIETLGLGRELMGHRHLRFKRCTRSTAQLRNKMRQEFERHRYVSQIGVVDVLLFQSHTEFQVSTDFFGI
jgi:hypothetical protein